MSIPAEIKDDAKERMKNPFIGAVGISFFLFNWKIFSHLFLSDLPVTDRLNVIGELGFFIWQPIVTALGYVLLMPWVSALIEWLRQFGTDLHKKVIRSQEPRLDLKRKFHVDNLTLVQALKIVRPNEVGHVESAVEKCKITIRKCIQDTNQPQHLQSRLLKSLEGVDRAFHNVLGLPLGLESADPEKN